MEKTFIANRENLDRFVGVLVTGVKAANSYSGECLSSSEVARARALNYVFEEFIERTIKAGYNAKAVLKDTMEKHGYVYWGENLPELKQVIDDGFVVDLSEFQQAMSYAFAVYERENALERGLQHGEKREN